LVLWLLALALNTGRSSADRQEKLAADKSVESKQKTESVKGIPARDPKTKLNLIDLSEFYNGSLTAGWLPSTDFGTTAQKTLPVPRGVQQFDKIDFDVRGLIQLSGQMMKVRGGIFPEKIKGIRVGLKCKRLHFLHAGTWCDSVENGTRIGSYVVHYADGEEREISIVSGDNVGDFSTLNPEAAPHDLPRAKVVWKGENAAREWLGMIGIYKIAWENPLPETEVKAIDFVSAMTAASPFLIAITAE
jgi:hypothetical protein